MARKNKPRLQLALYARPKHPQTYHYALIVAPKGIGGPATKHHVKNTLQIDAAGAATAPWRYEQSTVTDFKREQRILVRVIVAKLLRPYAAVHALLESLHVPDSPSSEGFDCQTWVKDAVEEMQRHQIISAHLDGWDHVNMEALAYLERKREQKRWDSTWKDSNEIPLMDLLEGKELVQ